MIIKLKVNTLYLYPSLIKSLPKTTVNAVNTYLQNKYKKASFIVPLLSSPKKIFYRTTSLRMGSGRSKTYKYIFLINKTTPIYSIDIDKISLDKAVDIFKDISFKLGLKSVAYYNTLKNECN